MIQPIGLADPGRFERGFPHGRVRGLRRGTAAAGHAGETFPPERG